jgi:4-amino-4-deoxy-L-arabinose transferase-like glycosyltransferase
MPLTRARTDAFFWTIAFLAVAAVIVGSGFTSEDPDSALYAQISDRMSREPVARWVAPEWWGFWPEAQMTGLFREHPAGLFWLPAALGRAGIPPMQAAYVVGVGAGLGALLLIGAVIARLTSADDGRAAIVLLQLMPVAFIFRIRANHEYPMLLALALTLAGLSAVARSWRWAPLVALGLTMGLLVKGVFVVIVIAAAALWVAVNPAAEPRARTRAVVALAAGALVAVAAALLYDWQYVRATGERFWTAYWQRQLGPLDIATPVEGGSALLSNVGFYATRLLWHPAPWSFALLLGLWRWRSAPGDAWRALPVAARHGLVFSVGFAAATVVILAPASRFAERYVFSATYAVGAAGAVVAYRLWPRLRAALLRADAAVPGFPAFVWLALMLLRLTVGSLLPRV